MDGDAKRDMLSGGDYYYDMMYIVQFSTFQKLPTGINEPNIFSTYSNIKLVV